MNLPQNYSEIFRSMLKQQRLVLIVIWANFIISQIFIWGVAYTQLSSKGGAPITSDAGSIIAPLAILTAVAIYFAFGYFTNEKIIISQLEKKVSIESLAAPKAHLKQSLVNKLKSLSEKELKLVQLSKFYFTISLVAFALAETIGILGFIVTITSRDAEKIIPYVVGAVAMLWVVRPDLGGFIGRASKLLDSR